MIWGLLLLALAIALIQLGRLSQRMGTITHARPVYRAFYVAAALLIIAALTRSALDLELLAQTPKIVQNSIHVLLVDGLAALGITIALPTAWYYWSWLLAERD